MRRQVPPVFAEAGPCHVRRAVAGQVVADAVLRQVSIDGLEREYVPVDAGGDVESEGLPDRDAALELFVQDGYAGFNHPSAPLRRPGGHGPRTRTTAWGGA